MLSLAAAPAVLRCRARRSSRSAARCSASAPRIAADAAAAPAPPAGRRGVLLAAAAVALLPVLPTPPPALAAAQLALGDLAEAVAPPAKVFVAGSTGQTGRRVVAQLRAAGVAVRAGARDTKKAQSLGLGAAGAVLVHADVTEGVDALVDAIGDADAVVCATGFTPSFNFGKDNAKQVDGVGTRALVDAAKRAGVKRFVLVTSLLTNAPAIGQAENPNYKFLNALGGILDEKHGAEEYLKASGLSWTIIRPGGLSNDPPSVTGNPLLAPADTFMGLPEEPGREVSRDTVAEVAVAALSDSRAANAVFELVASTAAPPLARADFFAKR